MIVQSEIDLPLRERRRERSLPPSPPASPSQNENESAAGLDGYSELQRRLRAPAAHLASLVESIISNEEATPSIRLVEGILRRAQLPIEIVALAARILQSFPRDRRKTSPAMNIMCDLMDGHTPEVLILAALCIASKFIEDYQEEPTYYAETWGDGIWPCKLVNNLHLLMLEDLEWKLLSLWQLKEIRLVIKAMRKAGAQGDVVSDEEDDGGVLTPAATPTQEVNAKIS